MANEKKEPFNPFKEYTKARERESKRIEKEAGIRLFASIRKRTPGGESDSGA